MLTPITGQVRGQPNYHNVKYLVLTIFFQEMHLNRALLFVNQ